MDNDTNPTLYDDKVKFLILLRMLVRYFTLNLMIQGYVLHLVNYFCVILNISNTVYGLSSGYNPLLTTCLSYFFFCIARTSGEEVWDSGKAHL